MICGGLSVLLAHLHPTSTLWKQANHFLTFFFSGGENEWRGKQKLLSSQKNKGKNELN